MKFIIIKNKQLVYLTISLLASVLCSSFSYSQTYPLQGNLVLKAPHSPYIADYTSADHNTLLLTFVSTDPSTSVSDMVLRMSIKAVGLTIQTSPSAVRIPISFTSPLLLSGSDLASYFSSSNLSFSGYSKTQYEQKGTLPEGLYEFSFQAFDARRNDIAVSNVASFMCWIQLHDPPQLIFPKNQSTAESKTPQQVSFQWQGTTLTNVTYELELYELRVTDKRDPNEVIRGASPIFTTATKASTYIYTIKDPPLQDGMNYAWRVRAKTDTDKELIKNGGYSSTFTFTYLPICKTPSLVKSLPNKNKTALISWAGEGKEYLIQYREEGQTDWYEELSLTQSLTITQLRPGKKYEYRIKSICEYNYSNYTKTDTFSIPYATSTTPLTPPAGGYPGIVLDKSTYLEEVAEGMIIKVNYFEMKIIKAVKNEQTKLWTGTGTMYFPSLKANVLMEFKDIHINKDQRLVAGHIHSVRAPKLMTKVKLPPVKQAKKICLTYGPDGYDEEGYNKEGYDRAGYNKEGRDKEGYDKLGYNAQNVDRNGNPKQTPPTNPTPGNPTASSGTNTNGNNTTQTGTSGSTSGQGGSGGNTTSTGTNGNSGGATPTTSIEEDAFTLELVSYYEQVIVAYLTEHPELKGSGPEPWYGGNTTQLPPCLEDHKEDIEYIRQYLSVSKNDKAKRAELIQKMKSNDSFMSFFKQALDEKKKTGNESKTYKELLSNTDWIKLAEKTCNEIYQVAGEHYIKTIVSDLVSSECASRAAQKAINRFNPLKLYSYGTATLAAITEAWLCATEQDKCEGRDYWTQYSYGVLHAVIEQADLLAMSDVLKELFQSQYQSRMSCLGKESDIKIRAVQETETEEAIHQALKCVLGIDVTVTELEQRYALTKSYIEKNWQEPYFRGEATVLISTLIVPTAKGVSLIRKGILAKFKKAATFSKEIATLEALEATNGKIDDIAKVMKESNVGKLFTVAELKALTRSKLADFVKSNLDNLLTDANRNTVWSLTDEATGQFKRGDLIEEIFNQWGNKYKNYQNLNDIIPNYPTLDFDGILNNVSEVVSLKTFHPTSGTPKTLNLITSKIDSYAGKLSSATLATNHAGKKRILDFVIKKGEWTGMMNDINKAIFNIQTKYNNKVTIILTEF